MGCRLCILGCWVDTVISDVAVAAVAATAAATAAAVAPTAAATAAIAVGDVEATAIVLVECRGIGVGMLGIDLTF